MHAHTALTTRFGLGMFHLCARSCGSFYVYIVHGIISFITAALSSHSFFFVLAAFSLVLMPRQVKRRFRPMPDRCYYMLRVVRRSNVYWRKWSCKPYRVKRIYQLKRNIILSRHRMMKRLSTRIRKWKPPNRIVCACTCRYFAYKIGLLFDPFCPRELFAKER